MPSLLPSFLLLLQPRRSCLPLGMMPALSRVAGTCPAGNQHFLMPFGETMPTKAGINYSPFQYVPATYRDWYCNFTPFPHFLCLTHGAPSPQIVNHQFKFSLASSDLCPKRSCIFWSVCIFILPDLICIHAYTHRHLNFTTTISINLRWTPAARQNTAHFELPGLKK